MKHIVLLLVIAFSTFSSSPLEKPVEEIASIQGEDRMIPLPLQFEKVVNENEKVTILQVNNIREVLERKKFGNVEFFIYKKTNDPYEELYGGIQIGNQYYQFGQIGYGEKTNGITIESKEVFEKKLVKVEGYRGANYRVSFYFQLKNDEVPSLFLFVDGGTHYEGKIDGEQVIIGSNAASISFHTTIYRMEGEQLVFADMNKQLQRADSVRVTDDLHFEVRQKPDSILQMYKYSNKNLIPIS